MSNLTLFDGAWLSAGRMRGADIFNGAACFRRAGKAQSKMNLDGFHRTTLCAGVTPLDPMSRLEQKLGGGPKLFVKRDDCTGLAIGGNKTRKLEFAVGEALAQGADTLITAGGIQSNHARQTAAAAARNGLACELVLARNVPIDTESYLDNGNNLLDRLFGARIHVCPGDSDRMALVAERAGILRQAGARPYAVPVGASYPIGSLGYVNAAFELVAQARERDLKLDYLVTANASGGTLAGLATGFAALQYPITLIAVGVDPKPMMLETVVAPLIDQTRQLLGVPASLPAVAIEAVLDQVGPGYGMPTPQMHEAVHLAARYEGILLDPVYTGKTMAGLISLVRAGRFEKDSTVVFLHTGGTPALFAYQPQMAEAAAAFADIAG